MNGLGNLLRAWDFDPSIVIGCIALLAAYALAHRGDYSRAPWFVAGVVAMFLALVSPLDALSDEYLFSAHMLQHLILILIVPPLLILGLSEKFVRAILAVPMLARIERILAAPAVAWTLAMAVLWIWHWPALYDATLASEDVHIFEHLCFLVTATIFWWPIFAPVASAQMEPMLAIIYLATAMVANSVLGILLTFANPGLYSAYLHPADSLGILLNAAGRMGPDARGRSAAWRTSDVGAGRNVFSGCDYVCDGPMVFGAGSAQPPRRCRHNERMN